MKESEYQIDMKSFEAFPPLCIGSLTVPRPIIQGGMGVGISLSSLAGAVAKEGGVGVISAAHPGFLEPDFDQDPRGANLRGLAKHIHRAKEIAGIQTAASVTSPNAGTCGSAAPSAPVPPESRPEAASASSRRGLIGVNIMYAMEGYEDFVRCAAQNGADLIISGAGLPADLPALVEGTKAMIAPIVSPPKAARVLLKRWDKHYNRTADLVVIEGPKAGGHLGYSPEEIKAHEATGYDREILEIFGIVKEYEEKYQRHIPVVFGGGVFTHEDILHYLSLGCSGVQIASRFVATAECDADQRYKNAYLAAKKKDIVIVKSPVGMPGRALNNGFVQRTKLRQEPIRHCWNCLRTCDRKTIPYCITQALINAAKGDLDNALIFCGDEVGRIHEMTTVPELMRELCGE